MECMKDDLKCIHNGECSKEFVYKIHTFVGALEISINEVDENLSVSKSSIFDEKTITFPRLVILRPKCLTQIKNMLSTTRILEYTRKKDLNELINFYLNDRSKLMNYETKQLLEFSCNCIFEINSKNDVPLLTELRSIYGPPEFLDSENNIDSNLIGNLLEKDESGILVINPWEETSNRGPNLNTDNVNKFNVKHGTESNISITSANNRFNKINELTESSIDLSTYSTATIQCLAIFGIIFIFEEPYLLISTNRERSSIIYQNGRYKTINRVTKSLALPLFSNSMENEFFRTENQSIDKKFPDITNDFELEQIDSSHFKFKDFAVNQNSENKNKEKVEWVNRISQTLQKMSPIKNKKETFSSILGESGAHWLSNSIFSVSSGILDSVTTAFSTSVSQQNNINKNIDNNSNLKNNNFLNNEFQSDLNNSNIPLSLEEILIERKDNLEHLLEGVTKMISSGGFYYSFDLDLTHTLQRKFEHFFQDYTERVGACGENGESSEEMRNRAYIITGDSRFIWNENISIPMLISGIDPRWVTPLVQGYFCNQAIVISPEGPGYVKIGSEVLSLKMNLINSFVDIGDLKDGERNDCNKKCKCRMCHQDHIESLTRYDILLMSRRAWERGGTRFNARGIDEDANVANFVESELQICINNSDHWFAFVQIRGSIPLFWEQTGVNSCAITCFDHDYSSMIFEKHHQKLVELYGEIFYINLLGSSTHEQALSMGLKKEINYYNLNIDTKFGNVFYSEDSPTGLICNCSFETRPDIEVKDFQAHTVKNRYRDSFCNCSCKAIPILYSNYDYHQKVKTLGFENALNEYVSYLAKELGGKLGYFHGVFGQSDSNINKNLDSIEFANLLDLEETVDYSSCNNISKNSNKESLKDMFLIRQRQKGVIRTNCLDCLDRTNALQWYISWTWFVDLILSISTCSVEIDINNSVEVRNNLNHELFIKSLFNSQLSHFGWLNLNLLNLNNGEKSGSLGLFDSNSSIIDSSSEYAINSPNVVKSSSLTPANKISSKTRDNDLKIKNSSYFQDFNMKNYRISPRNERHSFLVRRKSNFQLNHSLISGTNLANCELSPIGIDTIRNINCNNADNKTRFDGFKNCLLNGMGIVTLKDSFSLLWAENGDIISELYTGVGSVFSGVIKNRKVSLSTNFDHALKSLRRLYHNAFEDSSRQQYINCLLFKHPSNSNINIGITEGLIKDKIFNLNKNFSKCLKKDLKSHKLTIWVGTWNLAGQPLQVPLDSWINSNIPKNTSIVCFCLQEVVELSGVRIMFNQNDRNREALFEMYALKALGNNEYVKLQSSSLVGLFCVIFIRKSFKHFIKSVESSSLKLGLMGNTGNKGAVIIRINIEKYGSIVITNVHLTSGEQYNEERMSQLKMIFQSSIFNDPIEIGGYLKHGNCLLDHDLVIIAGDFNFRIQLSKQKVIELLQDQKFDELIGFDQFILESHKTDLFSKLIEKRINFPPTYKFARGECYYDQSRTPSWCDRIFIYKRNSEKKSENFTNDRFDFNFISQKDTKDITKNSRYFKDFIVEIIDYRSDQTYFLSDHQPVSAIISILFQS